MYSEEISNIALRQMVEAGALEECLIFKHRYDGGNVDWGYTDPSGYHHAFFGSEIETVYDTNEEAQDALEIIMECSVSEIDRLYRIEIACDHAEAERFADWLTKQGHEAWVGDTTRNHIYGSRLPNEDFANQVINRLWEQYCNQE